MTQSQVAQKISWSERTYADLERGLIETPTTELLDDVAEVLLMTEDERTSLYVFALGHVPAFPMDPSAGLSVAPSWLPAVERVTGQPCYINDAAWNLVAANDDFIRMFPREPGSPVRLPEQNLMRWMLLRPEAREHHLVDWEERWAPPVAAQLRIAVAAQPDNPILRQLHEDTNADPVAGRIYREVTLSQRHPDGDARPVRYYSDASSSAPDTLDRCCDRHSLSQLGTMTMCSAQPFGSPGARFFLLVFNPTPLPGRGR